MNTNRIILAAILVALSVACAWAGGPEPQVTSSSDFNTAVASLTSTLSGKPSSPVSIANGGTGQIASSAALSALGGLFPSGVNVASSAFRSALDVIPHFSNDTTVSEYSFHSYAQDQIAANYTDAFSFLTGSNCAGTIEVELSGYKPASLGEYWGASGKWTYKNAGGTLTFTSKEAYEDGSVPVFSSPLVELAASGTRAVFRVRSNDNNWAFFFIRGKVTGVGASDFRFDTSP